MSKKPNKIYTRRSNFGKKLSVEHRKKMSDAKKRNPVRYWLGKKVPLELVKKRILGRKKPSPGMSGKHHSKESRLKIAIAHKGSKSHLWKGGVTSENKKLRSSIEYSLWREAVFKRDDYRCVFCGIKSAKGIVVYLHADHIKPFAYFPKLRLDINNGRTLCKNCHEKTDTYKGRANKHCD